MISGDFGRLRWRQALYALIAVLGILLLLYRETFAAMVGIWSRSDTFAHAFLVMPISLWLVWRQRATVASLEPHVQPWFLAPIAAFAAAWLVGDLAGANAVTQLASIAMLVLTVPLLLGSAVARELAFPLGFLFFMVPLGEFAMPTLMEWTADFTVAALRLTGVPVFREGLRFVIPSGSWSVVEACSGVRYLIASLMAGMLFAYLHYRSTSRRLVFCGVAVLLPVFANWVRAYIIVMIGHLSSNQLATGVDHLVYGWVFFAVVMSLMFYIGVRWSEPEPLRRGNAERTRVSSAAPISGRRWPWRWAIAIGVVGMLPHLPHWHASAAPADITLRLPELPSLANVTDQPAEPALIPVFNGAAATSWRHYGKGEQAFTVHVAYFRGQGYGRKLISSDNALATSKDPKWNRTATVERDVTVGGQTLTFKLSEMVGGGKMNEEQRPHLQVRQIYWVNGQLTASDYRAAVLGVIGQLSGHGDDAAAITVYTDGADRKNTTEVLDQFTAEHLPTIQAWLTSIRARR